MKLVTNLAGLLKNRIKLCYNNFFPLDVALQNINLKLTVRSINRKSNFQLSFLPHHSTISVFH